MVGDSTGIGKQFRYERRVHFDDTDMGGVVHFCRLLAFVEEAEHAALGSLGIPVAPPGALWPRVRLEADFRAPAVFGDVVKVLLNCQKIGRSSLAWAFRIEGGRLLAEGVLTSCHVRRTAAGGFHPAPLPAAWKKALASLS